MRPPRRRLLAAVLALIALLAAGAFVACGSDDASVDEVLAETFGEEREIRSGRLDLTLRIDARGLPTLTGPVAVRLSGPFQSQGNAQLPRFDFNLGIEGSGQSIQAGAVSTGDRGFVRFGGAAYALGDQLFRQFREGYAEQARCTEDREEGLSFRTLGIDPRRWLREAQDAGTEEVGGVEATHVRARVDVPRFLDDVNRVLGRTAGAGAATGDPCAEQRGRPAQPATPQQLSDAERREIARAIRDARIDVWSGEEDRTLRRLNVVLRLEVPEERRSAANGLESGTVSFDLLLGALNEDQEITAPRGAQPLERLTERLGGQLPGLPGTGTGAGGESGAAAPTKPAKPEPPEPGATGGASPEYLRCLSEAGEDLTALQRCEALARG